jgi:PTH2 family peptidyl-tRNA hydrolase
MPVKQVIVMRKDLRDTKGNKVHTGKLIAQGAHASMKFVMDELKKNIVSKMWEENEKATTRPYLTFKHVEFEWMEGIFTKICVYVNSEQELLDIHNKALEVGLTSCLITDSGLTEFGGVPTNTCCAIGPDKAEKIDEITGKLPLL